MKEKLKKQEIGFTQVKNKVLEDKNLSMKAKGLFAYLYSKPDEWDFSGDRIVKDCKDGRKSIFAGLKELEENGYLTRSKNADGRVNYYISHSKKPKSQKGHQGSKKPVDHFGKVPKRQSAEKGSISNTDIKVIKSISNKDTSKEVEQAPKSYGREDINQSIQILKDSLGGSPDGTIKENRRYAKMLIDKLKKDYPGYEPTEQIKYIINFGSQDEFHAKNMTSFKYIYYNTQKIVQSIKQIVPQRTELDNIKFT